ncbi:RNA polymerase sigma-70 factor (ECF subfamily) [Actinopolymorpha pittospori]|uniref:RNA polymerase sigma-70 factor (ECF subfamily) n=2 Tax=Actinopolymorpha pittospori TaxID=648752 RepID=A0A927R9L9_9ACTN|nr:RNA polymerase sigma-70 factor (ECF subfamily) [Actinopolymorpha pittospori]
MTMNPLEAHSDDAAQTSLRVYAAGDRLISELDAAVSVFVTARPRLFGIALRVLEDVGEAEDVVQDTWLRWERADRSVVLSPSAFLATTISRLAINVTQTARRRRETSAGAFLPEQVDRGVGPETAAERHEAVDVAVQLLLETLTPAERAAYLLRKAFDYPYRRISEILHLGADHTRQLVRRAQERIVGERRQPVDAVAHRRLVRTFLAAAQSGDLAELEELLVADVAANGGSRVRSTSSSHRRCADRSRCRRTSTAPVRAERVGVAAAVNAGLRPAL